MKRSSFVCSCLAVSSLALLAGCDRESFDDSREKGRAFVAASDVFLNELHYDNVGTDSGEAIEIAGPAGTDLSGYGVVLYNGLNGAPYDTQALSGTIPDEGAGFGTVVVTYPANGVQNGSPDGVALVRGSEVLQFLSYEGAFVAVGGPADGLTSTDIGVAEGTETPVGRSLQLTGTGTRYEDFVWAAPSASSFGAVNVAQSFGEDGGTGGAGTGGASTGGEGGGTGGAAETCGTAATPIANVQGAGDASPLANQIVAIEGVVVGDFQGSGAALGGFFVQSETPDENAATSEGVFVYDPGTSLDVTLGQRVRVRGTVTEHFGLTELTAAAVLDCGTGALPSPAELELPVTSLAAFEALEGMLVRVHDLTATETYTLGRYGEVTLSAGGRLFHPTNDAGTTAAENALRRIVLDDARNGQNLEPVPYLGGDGTLRLGDRLGELTAVLSFGFDLYRLQPLDPSAVSFARENPRTAAPANVGGDVRLASLNVLNYFTTLGDRGAHTETELVRQRAKLVQAVVGLDADVLGLMEIENAPEALDDFVASINAELGGEVYRKAPDPAFTGTDAIRTALVYKPARVTALDLTLSDENPIHNRPPLAQAFSFGGNRFSVVVNHFKSKGSCPASSSDPNADFGQGCWNVLRVQQAEALVDFIAEFTAQNDDPDVVVLGDLNSYLGEDPISVLEESGLVNWDRQVPAAERYSYVFGGESGVLDYALTSPSLSVSGATIWHINADEPLFLDYNTEFNPASAYQPNAYRSSDHDPVVLGLNLAVVPLELLHELSEDAYALVRGISWIHRARVLLRLELAEAALRLAERHEARLPFVAALQRAIAARQLDEFVRIVEELGARGALPTTSVVQLVTKAQMLTDALR